MLNNLYFIYLFFFIVVERHVVFVIWIDTTPQAPCHLRYEQISSNVLLSWQPGYDGGRKQDFIIWFRLINKKRHDWKQIRVLPENTTDFILFDLKRRYTYEVTLVAENDFGLGTFSSILSIYMSPHDDSSIDSIKNSNRSDLVRPLTPTDLQLVHSGSDLHISWNHPIALQSSVDIVYYVLQWRSTTFFSNQYSQQSTVVHYPVNSFTFKQIKQSKYTVQVVSYSYNGVYSRPIEGDITIRMYFICCINS
jgi:hypothetical protein